MKQNTRFSTHVFNLRLFVEGLKRLRVIGITSAVLALSASALVPIVTWIEALGQRQVGYLFTNYASVPTALMVLVAPFFFLVLFSFLWKRKDSDFFHAIPYTRTCVYISFTLAALAFIFAIQIACSVVSGALWSACPYMTVDLGTLAAYTLVCMEAAAMLSAFMVLAMTVSGTAGCVLLFCLFAGFTRIVATVFLGMVETLSIVPILYLWQESPLSPLWFAPLSTIYYMVDQSTADVFFSLGNILYTVIVTVGLYTLGGFLYGRRHSEMAGNPAPGTRTQTLFRVLFSLIPALLMCMFFVVEGEVEFSITLILLVATLLVYCLYELITTKRVRNVLRALPGLGFVAAGCAVMLIAFFGWRTFVLNETIEASDIRSVSLENNGFGILTHPEIMGEEIKLSDSTILSVTAEAYAQTQQLAGEEIWKSGLERHNMIIRLKSGRTLHRVVYMTETQCKTIVERCLQTQEYRERLSTLPDWALHSGSVHMTCHLSNQDSQLIVFNADRETQRYDEPVETFLSIFRSEFATLDEEARIRVTEEMLLAGNRVPEKSAGFYITVSGIYDKELVYDRVYSRYRLTDDLPRTRDAYLALLAENSTSHLRGVGYEGGIHTLSTLRRDLRDQVKQGERDSPISTTLYIRSMEPRPDAPEELVFSDTTAATAHLSAQELEDVVALLCRNRVLLDKGDSESLHVTENTCLLDLEIEQTGTGKSNLFGLFELSPTTLSELYTLLHITEK